MKFTLEKNPSKIFLFTTRLLLLVIPCRKATNSAGTGARQSASESAQLEELYMSPNHLLLQGGHFHLKVGGAKSSGNAGVI